MNTSGLANARWRKSRRSSTQGACVEVALTSCAVGVRDSKDRAAGHVTVDAARWNDFVSRLKTGALDG